MKKLLFTTAFILCVFGLSAQGQKQFPDEGFSIHLGGVFPSDNFGEEPMSSDDGPFYSGRFSAGTGLNVGMKYKFSLASTNGLGLFLSADVLYNGIKGELADMYDDAEAEGADITRHKYLNIPIFAGINYRYDLSPYAGLWVEAGVGPNFRKITNTEYNYSEDGYSETEKLTFKTLTSFGMQIGGGVMINDRVSIGVHYYGLGKTKIKGKTSYSGEAEGERYSESENFTYNRKSAQNSVVLRLGFHF